MKAEREQRKKPITTTEHFEQIYRILKANGMIPETLLDYGGAARVPVPIKTYEFEIRSNLDYGSCEGIYLDLWIEYYEEEKRQRKELGTFKTLQTDRAAMWRMAQLLADFIVEERKYINQHLDDFTWTGVSVYAEEREGEKSAAGYECANMERALLRKEELIKRFPCVIVRDNATRQETVYKRSVAV